MFFSLCIPTIPVGIAVAAAAPAGHSELPQLSGFGHQADPEEVGLLAESESGFVHPAESMLERDRGTTEGHGHQVHVNKILCLI